MRLKILLFLICLLGLNISICSASKVFNAEQAAIGGISVGSSTEYIRGIYGDPNKILVDEDSINSDSQTWYYGDTFMIDFVNGIASCVVTSGNNGLTTPDGVTVGMKKKAMTSKYGSPKTTDKYGNRAIYTYQTTSGIGMVFVIRDGIISEIRVKQ